MASDFDVLIIGGGIIGTSIAWQLARDNHRILLLEANKIGSEASSAAAGMLSPHVEFDDPAMLDFALDSFHRYPDFVGALHSDSGLPIEFRRSSTVEIAASGAGDSRQYTEEAIVNPADLMKALRAACLRRSVCIREESPVASVAVTATDVGVFGSEARFAVLAAGAWSSSIAVTVDGELRQLPRSYPIKGHLLGYRLPPGSVPTTIRQGHTYILQRADGFTIAGSSTEDAGYDRTIDPKIVSDIAVRASALVPALRHLQPESVWIGFRPGTDSAAPNIGRLDSSRLWLAYGHYRNGILLAPATADRICREIFAALE